MIDLFLTTWPSVDRPGEGRTYRTTVDALAASLRAPKTWPRKADLPRVALATFADGYRKNDGLIAAFAIAVDVDAPRFDDVAAALPFRALLHSTWSGGVRGFVMIDRPIRTADDYRRAGRFVLGHLERAGIVPDYSSLVVSQPWAVPASRPGYRFAEISGPELDVRHALRVIPRDEPQAPPARDPRDFGDDLERRTRRASAWLAKVDPAISGSRGSVPTFRAALGLVRGFNLPADVAFELMRAEYNPRCLPPWSERELRHKIRQALQRGRRDAGFLSDVRRRA